MAVIVEESRLVTQYLYINFEKIADKPKTSVWACKNNTSGAVLGIVKWYPRWRQYCFFPEWSRDELEWERTVIFSAGCMRDIIDFIGQLR